MFATHLSGLIKNDLLFKCTMTQQSLHSSVLFLGGLLKLWLSFYGRPRVPVGMRNIFGPWSVYPW